MSSHTSQVLTTSSVQQRQAADYWVDIICETFVKLSAHQVTHTKFYGEIRWEKLGDLEFSTVTASGQEVFRTKEFVSAASDEYLLFSIQRRGKGVVVQDGRTAILNPASMAIYDSSRPYSLHFPAPFQQLVVQIPKNVIGVDDTREITASVHQTGTPEAVIAQLLVSMSEQLQQGGNALGPLQNHILGAVSEIVRRTPERVDPSALETIKRSRILEMMRNDLSDPGWTVEQLAKRCHMSKRSLYRLFADRGPASVMRSMRVDEAKRMLRQETQLLVATLAHHCGFDSESGFIRAFRAETGMTPTEYVNNRAGSVEKGLGV